MSNLEEALKTERVVYSEETIKARVAELGKQITEDYAGKELVVIGVIKGSLYFLSDLTRAIDLPVKVDMIGFSNIPDTTSKTGIVRITKDIDIDITDKHVLVVEDVIRTGLTTAYIILHHSGICALHEGQDLLCSLHKASSVVYYTRY